MGVFHKKFFSLKYEHKIFTSFLQVQRAKADEVGE